MKLNLSVEQQESFTRVLKNLWEACQGNKIEVFVDETTIFEYYLKHECNVALYGDILFEALRSTTAIEDIDAVNILSKTSHPL